MEKSEFYQDAVAGVRGPLEGVRVLEATNFGAGPICGMVLVDLGAESIKCELPGVGDSTRSWPPLVGAGGDLESSVWNLTYNRGKRGVTLDFRAPEGQKLFLKLAAEVDIVVENFTPGTMAGWGLGYEEIRADRPEIIYVSISGFGQFGPLHKKKGLDPIAQAMGGVMSATGEKGGEPIRVGYAIADNMGGWQGAMGAVAALNYRDVTGRGQHVDASLVDAMLYASDAKIMGTANGQNFRVERTGNSIDSAPFNTYLCKDGVHLFIHAVFDPHWRRLCEVMGCPELAEDERTLDWGARTHNFDLVDGIVADWAATLDSEQIMPLLDAAGVTNGPVLGFAEIINNEHFRQRESVVEIDHPQHGPLTTFGVPIKFSTTPSRPAGPSPGLGRDNDAVYRQLLGLGDEELAALAQQGVI